MNRSPRFSGIACIACLLLTLVALLLLTSSARAQLTAQGVAGLRLGSLRVQVDSVSKADGWGFTSLIRDPYATTLDLLPDMYAPRTTQKLQCDSSARPPFCTYIDRVTLAFVRTGADFVVTQMTVRMRPYDLQGNRGVEESLKLHGMLSRAFCSEASCTSSPAPKAARLRSALTAQHGGDTTDVGVWSWPAGAKESLSRSTLRLIRNRTTKQVWCEVFYEDLQKR